MCLVLPNTLLYLLLRDNTSFDVLETSTVYLIEAEYASVAEIEELRTALINVFR